MSTLSALFLFTKDIFLSSLLLTNPIRASSFLPSQKRKALFPLPLPLLQATQQCATPKDGFFPPLALIRTCSVFIRVGEELPLTLLLLGTTTQRPASLVVGAKTAPCRNITTRSVYWLPASRWPKVFVSPNNHLLISKSHTHPHTLQVHWD